MSIFQAKARKQTYDQPERKKKNIQQIHKPFFNYIAKLRIVAKHKPIHNLLSNIVL